MGFENSPSFSRIISNKSPCNHQDATTCVDTQNGSGKDEVISSHSISYLAPHPRHRHKRGRPRKYWAHRDAYQRRHCPFRLRPCEVQELFEADRFASHRCNRLQTFITLRWFLTQDGETNIQARWPTLLNALRIWASRQGFELAHVWTHENPPRDEPAFNSHLLANVPPNHREKLKAWLVKQLGGFDGAIDIQPRTCIHWLKPDKRISYLCKGTDRGTAMKWKLITDKGWDYNQGVVPFQRSGTSRNINATSRTKFFLKFIRKETLVLTRQEQVPGLAS